MLREHFGIQCTKRCEEILALAYLNKRVDAVAVAHTLPSSERANAVKLAQALLGVPVGVGELMAVQSLRSRSTDGTS